MGPWEAYKLYLMHQLPIRITMLNGVLFTTKVATELTRNYSHPREQGRVLGSELFLFCDLNRLTHLYLSN